MADVAVQITCKIDDVVQRIILDTVDDVQVSLSSTVTNHPIVNGDIIADHMYNNPATMSMTGKFSLNGGMGIVVTADGPKLQQIQSLFERIKREGIMCEIVKLTVSLGDNGVRFMARSNMVLTSINWTEKINSLGFSFGWTETLVSDIQEYDVDIDDQFLPSVTEPKTMNFTDTIIDWTQIDSMVISSATDAGLIEKAFLDFIQGFSADALVGLGVGAAVAVTVFVALGSIPGPGWIAAGVVAAAVLIVGLIGTIVSFAETRQFALDTFKYYEDDRKAQAEVQRFSNFIGGIHQQLQQLNGAIQCWQIGSNEEQECMISIDNNYYIFTFKKNNTSGKFRLDVTDIDNAVVGKLDDVTAAPTSFSECTTSNSLFRAYESGAYVYLVLAGENDSSDLTNYFVVSTTLNPEEFEQTLQEVIINAIYR